MAAVGTPKIGQFRRTSEKQQTWMRRPHPLEQTAPGEVIEAVVAKDDAGARGQPGDDVEQPVAQPLVGHQP